MGHPFFAQFFSYDPERGGIQFHNSLAEAVIDAKSVIHEYCDDFWDEDGVRQVCAGVILHRAELTYEKTRPDDKELDPEGFDSEGRWWGRTDDPENGCSEYDEIWDFTLEPQKIPDEILALIPMVDLEKELSRREGGEA